MLAPILLSLLLSPSSMPLCRALELPSQGELPAQPPTSGTYLTGHRAKKDLKAISS